MNPPSASELHAQLATTEGICLLDVLPREHFDAVHLPGARNACVYEVSFLDQVRAAADGARLLVVYGSGLGTRETQAAAEKLAAAGYENVVEFRAGLAGWEAAGYPLERGAKAAEITPDGTYLVDSARSVIRWTGRNLFNHHEGTVRLTGGEIRFASGRIEAGEFVVDLGTIACTDLEPGMAAGLIRHLHDADFFEVARFPTARFALTAAAPLPAASPGSPNETLSGNLTLRGETHPLEFPAVVAAKSAGEVVGQAQVAFDRTLWGAIYGSGKFFSFLGPHVVNDLVDLHLKIIAVRTTA